MKIAIINPWAISSKSIGGTERFVMDLAESLNALGNEIDVYMFSGKSHIEKGINYININLFDIAGEADEYIIQETFGDFETTESYESLARKIEKKIDVSKYDCIHLNSQLFLQVWKEKKRIFTIHTNPFEYELAWGKKSYYKMLEIMREYKNNKLTTFVAPSKYYANEYQKLTGCKIEFIPHAIDIARLYTENKKENIIKKYNLSEEKIRIIVPSRLEPMQKQPMLLIDACILLEEDIKRKIEIVFTGLDKQYIKFVDKIKEKAKNHNIDIKIIRFDEMSEVYKIADITVLPSKSESFGYSALESLSLGIPTILNKIPTFKEIASGNDNCQLFNNSANELKEKIIGFINNRKYENRAIPNNEWSEKYRLKTFAQSYLNLMNL